MYRCIEGLSEIDLTKIVLSQCKELQIVPSKIMCLRGFATFNVCMGSLQQLVFMRYKWTSLGVMPLSPRFELNI